MDAMDALRKAQIENIALITEQKNKPGQDRRRAVHAARTQAPRRRAVVTAEVPHASADMNVTPLIDVLLVLLIIFMAALPLTQKGVDVNLPLETKKKPQQNPRQRQIVLEYERRRQYRGQPPADRARRARDAACATSSRPARKRRCSSSATRRCATARSSR